MSTTLLPDVLRGSQKPRILTRPQFTSEASGQEAIDLAESVGLHLDPWQQTIVRVALAEDARGMYAAREVGYLVARQNGKGAALEAITLHGLFLVGDPLTLWTAHQFKTSSEAFLRVRGWIDGSDDLRRLVKKVVTAHGEESIELHAGPRLRFLARSKSSGRGFSPQRIIWDEAQELAKQAHEAMAPSMRAQRNPQSIFTGTVPGPEINNPEHWRRMRDRGRAGSSSRLAWMEWTPKGSEDPDKAAGLDLGDRKHWAASNPAAGYREGLTLESLEADFESYDPDSFGRECCSVWPTERSESQTVFGQSWSTSVAEGEEPSSPAALGVAVSVDSAWASIGVADRVGDTVLIGANQRQRGTRWVVDELKRIQDARGSMVYLDSKGPAAGLRPELDSARVRYVALSTADVFDACAGIYEGIQDRTIRHFDHDDLNDAARGAVQRAVGDRWAWGRRKSTGDVSMLEAATLAAWGAQQSQASVYEDRDLVVL